MPEPTPLTRPTDFPEENGKSHIPGDPDLDPSSSDSSLKTFNSLNDRNSSKSKKRNAIRRKNVRKTRKMILQTHHLSKIMIRPTIVITDANYVRGRAIGKRIQ